MLLHACRSPTTAAIDAQDGPATAGACVGGPAIGSAPASPIGGTVHPRNPSDGPVTRTREVIGRHAARAAIGALTALAPESDLQVCGPVAAAMSRELARLCGADARPGVLESLLAEAQRQIEAAAPLFLAVAAMALERQPAAVARDPGLLRAVAVGLSFEALGKAVAEDLGRYGALRTAGAPMLLRSTSAADLTPLAPRYARLVRMARQRGAPSLAGEPT